MARSLLAPKDIYPARLLAPALDSLGQYVYGYYRPGEYAPFYVGKGSGARALDHWKMALKSGTRLQEREIKKILAKRQVPHIRFLAYNLDESEEDRHALAERVLQDAFGIQYVWEKTPGAERLEQRGNAVLLQKREDSSTQRPLSLEAAIALGSPVNELSSKDLQDISTANNIPILLVGLMKTYHPAYRCGELAEMARMYWILKGEHKVRTLKAGAAWLLAWSSKLGDDGRPRIVGGWIIDGQSARQNPSKRYKFRTVEGFQAQREMLGRQLRGTGNRWQGPRLYVP